VNSRGYVEFYRADTGASCGQANLDPSEIVPYERDQYRQLGDTYSLLDDRFRASAELLDNWGQIWVDHAEHSIQLSVLRPTSPVRMIQDRNGNPFPVCDVRTQSILARLSD
jgi:hypothetical protein